MSWFSRITFRIGHAIRANAGLRILLGIVLVLGGLTAIRLRPPG